jgi:hypothetical protein
MTIGQINAALFKETTWTDCRQVVEVQFGPGHDCGRLTAQPEVGFSEATANSA